MASVRAMISVSAQARASAMAAILPAISAAGISDFSDEVPAALGIALVLDLQRGGAGAFVDPHGALGVQRVAEAVVGVDDHRQVGAVADQRHRVGHLRERGQADIGPAQPGIGDRGAGEIQRLEPRVRRKRGGQRVVDARRDEDTLLMEAGGEAHEPAPIMSNASAQVICCVTVRKRDQRGLVYRRRRRPRSRR